jgi:DNA-binding transcriptional LysR family regulator
MDVQHLRCFLAVADELHFGRAAQRLHVAQPALSRTIKGLERELGTPLFIRSTRSVSLTPGGAALVGPAREVIEALRRAETAARSAEQGEIGVVRIAFAGLSTHRIVARLARRVRTRRPGIQIELSSQNFAQPAMKRLVQGDTDLALGRWDVIPGEVTARVVMTDSLVVALPDTNPLAGSRRLSIRDLAQESFVSLPPHEGAVLPDRLRRLASIGGFVADVVQIAPDTQTALALVSAEVGCHLTLASVAANVDDPHIAFIELAESPTDVDLRMAWRRSDRNPALRTVVEEMLTLDVMQGSQPG